MNGILQFIRYIIDRNSVNQVTQQSQQVGAQVAQSTAKGAQQAAGGITGAIVNAFKAAQTGVKSVTDGIGSQLASMKQKFSDAWDTAFPFTMAHLFADAIRKGAEFAKEMAESLIEAAASSQRIGIEFDSVFGDVADKADSMAAKLAAAVGASKNEMRESFINLQAFATGLGMGRDAAAGFSDQVATLAANVSAFKGRNFEEVLHAVQGGLVGMTRPLHQMGIMLYEANIQQEALVMTGKKHVDDLTDQEKALGAYSAMLRLAAPMMGSLERNQGTLTLAWHQFTAQLKDARDMVAVEITPVLMHLAEWLRDNADFIRIIVVGAFDILWVAMNTIIQPLRIFADLVIGTFYGWGAAVDVVIAGLSKLLSFVPGLEKLADISKEFMDQAVKNGERAQKSFMDIGGAIHDLFVPGADPDGKRHEAGALPGKMVKPEKEDKDWLEKQMKAIREGVQLDATRRQSLEQAQELQQKLIGLLMKGNLPFQEQVKYQKALNDLKDIQLGMYDRELAKLKEGVQHAETREDSVRRLYQLEFEFEKMEVFGDNAAIERAQRLHAIRMAIAEAKTDEVDKELSHVSAMDKSGAKLNDLYNIRKKINDLQQDAKTKEDIEAVDKLLKTINTEMGQFTLPEKIANVFESSISGTESFSEALKNLFSDARTVQAVLVTLGKGSAKSLLTELSAIAKGKALENLAWGIEDLGHAVFDSVRNPARAPAEFAAAGHHFKAAAAWGLVGASTGALAGSSSSAGASTPDRTGGDTADSTPTLPNITNIYIDGIDPDKASHQELVGLTIQQGIDRGVVNVYPGSQAPASLRGAA